MLCTIKPWNLTFIEDLNSHQVQPHEMVNAKYGVELL